MPDTIEQIKSRLDIADVIGGYVKLQKSGANHKARCPFHNEKTPSFHVSQERQIWHCFGCGKGGDVFGFIKEIEGVEFPEALRMLAQRAGIELERFDPKVRDEKSRLFQICDIASKFFEKQLWYANTGQKALAYLKNRGLTDDTIRQFRLGFAPNDWHALGRFLNDRGYQNKEIADAGLLVQRDGKSYDRFRSRITFPIADVNGQIVGFSARIFELEKPTGRETEPAKYINTPQTLIYDKSRILYGLDKAKLSIRQADRCVLVEGNMDAIMSFQGGVPHAVATSGTALTPAHLKLLQRYTAKLDFCFDADRAGALATRRGIGLALSQNCTVGVIEIPDRECKDPADYVAKHGAAWGEAVARAKPVIEFYFDAARKHFDPASVEDKKAVVAAVAPFVKRLTSRVERAHWVSQLAALLRVDDTAVRQDIERADDLETCQEPRALTPRTLATQRPAQVSIDILSEALLSVALKHPLLLKKYASLIVPEALDPQIAQVIAVMARGDLAPESLPEFMKEYARSGSYQLEFAYMKSQELWEGFKDEELDESCRAILMLIKRKYLSAQLTGLEFDIKQAEATKDTVRLRELARVFTEVTRSLAETA